jgi:dihydroxyacetone kinase-like protein
MHRYFLNDPGELVAEALAGLERSHPGLVRLNVDPTYVVRAGPPATGRVNVLSGGGSGHEPLHTGFVGEGLLDAAVPGAIFASPSVYQIEAAIRAVAGPHGVCLVVKNYTGDRLNFDLAAELVRSAGIEIATVLVDDDLATDSDGDGPGRRGTAAVVAVEKICAAAAARGADLGAVAGLGRRVVASARSLAVALQAGTHPGEHRPSFDLEDDEIEFGVGIHGERGVDRRRYASSDEISAMLVEPLVEALGLTAGASVLVIVNGLGSTHLLELSAMFLAVAEHLGARGVAVARSLVGSYVTSLNMAGCSVTLVRVDDELVSLWDDPVRTPALCW